MSTDIHACDDCGKRTPRPRRGLCDACYARQLRANRPPAECASCHEVKNIQSLGMCAVCYTQDRRRRAMTEKRLTSEVFWDEWDFIRNKMGYSEEDARRWVLRAYGKGKKTSVNKHLQRGRAGHEVSA